LSALTVAEATDLFRKAPDRLLDVGAGQVAYRRVGSGPDVLFVHGWPVSAGTFRQLLPHLTAHVTCHLVDLVGAGQSRFDRSTRIDVHQHVTSLRRVIDTLGLESFAVVGHDSGGLMARHATVGDPRLRSMVLLDTEQSQGLNWRFKQFLAMARLPGFESILAWAVMQPTLRRSRGLLGDCFTDHRLLDGDFEELFLRPLRDDPERRWAAGQLVRSFDRQMVSELPAIHARLTVPVQLAWGEKDPFFPIAWAREMVATFPDARLHVVPGAKLFVHEERPAEVAEVMLPTLLGLRASDG
jgi:pimeloyl-ACP methyl ester carboxylesterase